MTADWARLPYELVSKEKEIYVISDPNDLWVIAEIKERDIGAIEVGQDASFTVLAYPEEGWARRVFGKPDVARLTAEIAAACRLAASARTRMPVPARDPAAWR